MNRERFLPRLAEEEELKGGAESERVTPSFRVFGSEGKALTQAGLCRSIRTGLIRRANSRDFVGRNLERSVSDDNFEPYSLDCVFVAF